MQESKLILVTSWDDVTELDVKLANLLDSYGLKGSFYVIGKSLGKRVSKDQLLDMSQTHEIGAHTMTHPTLTTISDEEARREIAGSKTFLERTLGKQITSFAYPRGKYNKRHVMMAKEAGFFCARTIEPFYFKNTGKPYEVPVSIWAFPHKFRDLNAISRLIRSFPSVATKPLLIKNWNKLGKEIFDFLIEQGGVFHIFGHAWQIDDIDGWKRLEDLFGYVAHRKNVVYTTVTGYAENFLIIKKH